MSPLYTVHTLYNQSTIANWCNDSTKVSSITLLFQLIHEISEENGNVIISFPRSGTNSDKVVLKGAPKCIEGAKSHIQEIIEDLVGANIHPLGKYDSNQHFYCVTSCILLLKTLSSYTPHTPLSNFS